jgi:hypothetical protein
VCTGPIARFGDSLAGTISTAQASHGAGVIEGAGNRNRSDQIRSAQSTTSAVRGWSQR